MRAVGNLVFAHWPLKVTALLLATVLYVGLTLSESTRSWTGPVPIEVLNAPVGGALLENPGAVERIEYRAPGDIADALTNDSFRASIDLSNVAPRAGAEPVEVPIDVFSVDPRVRLVEYSPASVAVRVDEVVARSMPVQLDSGPMPEGIELGPVTAEPNRVTISGASSRVHNVRTVEGRFVVDASGLNIDEDVAVQAFDDVGALVPGIDVDPATVRVAADVARQLSYATVPIVPEIVGQPALGSRVETILVAPSAVTVSGANPDITRLESVATAPVDISGASTELAAEVPLILPEQVTTPGIDGVTVVVTFSDDVGTRGFELAPALVGQQPDHTYSVAETVVSVVVSGPLDELESIEAAELVAEVPVASLEVGDNEVMPIVETPRGTTLVRMTPATVRVTVDAPS